VPKDPDDGFVRLNVTVRVDPIIREMHRNAHIKLGRPNLSMSEYIQAVVNQHCANHRADKRAKKGT